MNNPYFLDWEITSVCNFRCKFCYLQKEKDLPDAVCLRIANGLLSSDLLEIKIGGGEPLIRKDLVFKVASVLSKEKSLVLVTNGFLIEKQDIRKLKRFFSRIQVSLYSLDEKEFESINGIKGSFRRVLDNIELLINNKIPIVLNFVLTNLNFKSLTDVHNFIKEKNLKMRILRYRGEEYMAKNNLNGIYQKYKGDKDVIFDEGFIFVEKGICGAIKNVVAISSVGIVYPCTWLRKAEFGLGDIRKQNLLKIINNNRARALRKEIDVRSSLEEDCPFFIDSFK